LIILRKPAVTIDIVGILFRKVRQGNKKPGYPKPKKRGFKDRFAIRDAAKFDFKNKTLRIEKLKTRIDMRQPIRFGGNSNK
jgi:putative transposase